MPCTDERSDYSLQGIINFELHPYNLELQSFMITTGRDSDIRQIVGKFLEELDDENLVQIEFEKKEPTEKIYGGRPDCSRFAKFEVHRDDISHINDKKPIRIKCYTDVFPNNKDAFIDFFKEFHTILGW